MAVPTTLARNGTIHSRPRPSVAPGTGTVAALVVHDDMQTIAMIEFTLDTLGFQVCVARSAETALTALHGHPPDLVVLDTTTTLDTAALHNDIRRTSTAAIILLTAEGCSPAGSTQDEPVGPGVCMTKPFHPRNLATLAAEAASRHRVVRRSGLHVGRLRIDQTRHTVSICGRSLDLPFNGFKLLTHLAIHRGQPQTWQSLLHTVWGAQTTAGGADIVKSAVYRLRGRLASARNDDNYIVTLRGAGYFMPDLPPKYE
ncbi:MAG: winged helix-turn-helix domain-containing protein [Actinomycetia bacterium]|nr:winged helix-turn-helix domain-containing protein [Actinomycetes bacterium]